MIDNNQTPALCPHTNKTNQYLNILANLWANSLLCRPTLICYVYTVIEAHKKDAITNLTSLL